MTTKHAQDRINYAIETLENAFSICKNVDYNDNAKCEQTPAYAIGYSTSTIKSVIFDLKTALEYLN